MSSRAAFALTTPAVFLFLLIAGCQGAHDAYRSTGASNLTPVGTQGRLAVSMTVQGVTQIRWVGANRVQDVLNSVPGIVAMPRGTDDLALRLWGKEHPTVMIDGVHALAADLLLLYPWEIGAIEILRDVPSTSVYGELGTKGIVRVTTKRTRQPQTN